MARRRIRLPNFALNRARELARSPKKIREVASRAREKLASLSLDNFENINVLLDYLVQVAKGNFKPTASSLTVILGGVIYFLMPLDLVPDFILVAGLLDDASVLAWVVFTVAGELERFSKWLDENPPETAPP